MVSKIDFFRSVPDDVVTDTIAYYLTMEERLRLSRTCKRIHGLLEDPVFWGRLVKDLGLIPIAAPVSRRRAYEQIKGVYEGLLTSRINQVVFKGFLITNFQKNLRTAWDTFSSRFRSEVLPSELRQALGLNRSMLPAKPNATFLTALAKQPYHMAEAIRGGCADFVEALVEAGAKPNEYMLDIAIRGKNPRIVRALLKINSPDKYHLALPRSLRNGGVEHDANLDEISRVLAEAAREKPLSIRERVKRSASIEAAFQYEQTAWEPFPVAQTPLEWIARIENIVDIKNPAKAIGALRGYFLRNYRDLQTGGLLEADLRSLLLYPLTVNQASDALEAFLLAGFRPDSATASTQTRPLPPVVTLFSYHSFLASLLLGNRRITDLLLEADATIHNTTSDEEKEEILVSMLQNGTFQDIEHISSSSGFRFSGAQLLNACVEVEDENKVYQLLEDGFSPSVKTLLRAIHKQNYPILNLLISFITAQKIKLFYEPSIIGNPFAADETRRIGLIKRAEKRELINAILGTKNHRIIRLSLKVISWSLNKAIATKDPEIVKISIDAGAKPEFSTWPAIPSIGNSVRNAILTDDADIVDLVLQAGGKPTKYAVHEALQHSRNPAIAKKLLAAGAKVFAKSDDYPDSSSTLDLALIYSHSSEIFDLLIEAKAPMSEDTVRLARATKKPEIISRIEAYDRALKKRHGFCKICTSAAAERGPTREPEERWQ